MESAVCSILRQHLTAFRQQVVGPLDNILVLNERGQQVRIRLQVVRLHLPHKPHTKLQSCRRRRELVGDAGVHLDTILLTGRMYVCILSYGILLVRSSFDGLAGDSGFILKPARK